MSRRRYKIGKHPQYDKRFDVLKGRSSILGTVQRGNFDFTKSLLTASIHTLKSAIADYEKKIKRQEETVAAVEQDWRASLQRMGKPIPAEPPGDVLRQRMEAEAKLDILGEEKDWLEKELKKMEAKAKAEDDRKVLYYGPQGSGKGDPLREIDGQKVENRKGELVIADGRSPYDGMRIADYREKLVGPYLKNHDRTRPVEKENLPPRPEGF
jgi:hypothetical protein